MPGMRSFSDIEQTLAASGLQARGGFHPNPEDGVPVLSGGRPAATLVLAGNVGPEMWQAFAGSPEAQDGARDPLNRWSERVLSALALSLDAEALFPFGGPPHLPFQRWALRAEPLQASPLGMLIHPVYGLWHAYRGALAFAEPVDLPDRRESPAPCDSCRDKPCLTTCPVAAFSGQGYDVPACAGHIAAPAGRDCLDLGCRARRACPVGREWLYPPAQAGFHMAAFLDARRRETP